MFANVKLYGIIAKSQDQQNRYYFYENFGYSDTKSFIGNDSNDEMESTRRIYIQFSKHHNSRIKMFLAILNFEENICQKVKH